ncbi:MAG: hypothetical protein ABR951_10005 [Candidatus Aminicenantales bacterium]|jgi:hypothetical protein
MNETFPTLLINSTQRYLSVFDATGLVTTVGPGEREVIESADPATLYSKYQTVEWRPEGPFPTLREGWIDLPVPEGKVRVLLRNIDGHPVEERNNLPGFGRIFIPRGIDVPLDVDLASPLSVYAELQIVVGEDWQESLEFPGYLRVFRKLVDKWIDRPDEELAAIAERLEKEDHGPVS